MSNVYCKMCPRHCYLGTYTLTKPPMNQPNPVPGTTPEGEELSDIREYCAKNYTPEIGTKE
jgi:hypothetical protein